MRTCALLPLLLVGALGVACAQEEPPAPKAKPVDIFFNRNMLDGILDVEEARRAEYLKQYDGRQITGRGELYSVHESDQRYHALGEYELLVIAQGVYRDVDVEYRTYVDASLAKPLMHARACLLVTGAIKTTEWIRTPGERALRVHLDAERVTTCP